MPVYEYRCEKGHTFEVMQRMSDDSVTSCTVCGAPCHRVLHPVAVHFKGSGFYTTDYGRKPKAGAASSEYSGGKASSDSGSGGDKKKESSGEKSGTSSSGSSD